eukprot:TRINITY_DN2052_c1_g1_i2.p1 TRINITY_DN2052_c1_g1~~TRINITY_DN2052_c1_g1_i2.p1  ORF type:complete len:199 (+),score=41.79 TRINITY_DN2052_c1_g1_i2:48-644(+)
MRRAGLALRTAATVVKTTPAPLTAQTRWIQWTNPESLWYKGALEAVQSIPQVDTTAFVERQAGPLRLRLPKDWRVETKNEGGALTVVTVLPAVKVHAKDMDMMILHCKPHGFSSAEDVFEKTCGGSAQQYLHLDIAAPAPGKFAAFRSAEQSEGEGLARVVHTPSSVMAMFYVGHVDFSYTMGDRLTMASIMASVREA